MNLFKLGKLIDVKDYFSYIEESEKLEVVFHNYGEKLIIPDYPCWMEYKNQGTEIGSISFTRHTFKHHVLREMTLKIKSVLEKIFPSSIPVLVERIHLLKTSGNIPIHKDESRRSSCINIGIKNSSVATTKISKDGIYNNFQKNHQSIRLVDGYGYLMNTYQWHSVESPFGINRYLITYGFKENFNYLHSQLKIKNE